MSKTKPTWGGSRKGAGRKEIVKDGRSLTLWIPGNVRKRLDAEAKKYGVPVTRLVRRILEVARRDLPW